MGKGIIRYNRELLNSDLQDKNAEFISAYRNDIKITDNSELNREDTIEFKCSCKKTDKKLFRNLHKTGALCKSCIKIQKNQRTAKTNIELYGNVCSAQGSKQQEKIKETISKNKQNRPIKHYYNPPNEVRLGIKHKKGCIYLITCLANGKQYVGLSKNETPEDRYKEHWHKRNDTSNSKPILHKAMDLYGKDMFIVETLCVVSYDGLYNMEAYYAEQFETYMWDNPGGYNMVWCGVQSNLGLSHSAETRAKISEKAKNRSAESRAKYSEAAKRRKPRKTFENLISSKNLTGQKYIGLRDNKFLVSIIGKKFKFYKVCITLENAIEERDKFIKTII